MNRIKGGESREKVRISRKITREHRPHVNNLPSRRSRAQFFFCFDREQLEAATALSPKK
jgi:hypothetical protein